MAKAILSLTALLALCSAPSSPAAARGDPLRPVPAVRVEVRSAFWSPRLETNRARTVRYDLAKCEETGRIANFARAAGLEEGGFQGIPFDDSDVFKVVEGASRSLALHPDPALRARLDELVAKIAGAQEEDGYLYTARTLGVADDFTGPERWSNLRSSHELYNVGHLYEAAVAHFEATGERTLLDVASKNAELVARTFGFGEGRRVAVPGHEEIELGLLRLHDATGEQRFLDLARFFVDARGRADLRGTWGPYAQDHEPVVEQREAVGHAVRAGYLYAAVAELAARTGDVSYRRAVERLWEDVLHGKMHLTGGVGARRSGEAFGAAFELPNASAYLETCAAIAFALFAERMFLLDGDAGPVDVLERVIHNGFLSGVSASGERFFYPNPLAWDGHTPFNQGNRGRAPWFSCSCCPVNVVRFLPSIPGFAYATRGEEVFVALYLGGSARIELPSGPLELTQTTRYPWDGRVEIALEPERAQDFTLRLRIPGWCRGVPAPGGLYRYADPTPARWSIAVNGEPCEAPLEGGWALLRRRWTPGDRVVLELEMPARRVLARPEVEADRGRVALERGPLVYCLEATDNGGSVGALVLPDEARLGTEWREELLGGVVVLRAEGRALREEDGRVVEEPAPLTAVPYHAWAERELGEMAVWLPREAAAAAPRRPATLASAARVSASHLWASDSLEAVNDRLEPTSSADPTLPRFTWWDHRGTDEWIQYDLGEPAEVSRAEVYWFDDTGVGRCRAPASWRLLWRDGGGWRPVRAAGSYGTGLDRFEAVDFEPVRTDGLRIEARLREGFSAGILEWKVR